MLAARSDSFVSLLLMTVKYPNRLPIVDAAGAAAFGGERSVTAPAPSATSLEEAVLDTDDGVPARLLVAESFLDVGIEHVLDAHIS